MRLLADENFHGDIVRGLLRVEPKLDLLRVQDTEVYQASDADVLAYAAVEKTVYCSRMMFKRLLAMHMSAFARV